MMLLIDVTLLLWNLQEKDKKKANTLFRPRCRTLPDWLETENEKNDRVHTFIFKEQTIFFSSLFKKGDWWYHRFIEDWR
jgi:hypothetical protein